MSLILCCTRLYLEVIRVYLQFLGVQHTQVFEWVLDVVQVLRSFCETTHDHFSMSCHFGICHYRIRTGEVSKFTKISLSPGVDNQTSEGTHTHKKKRITSRNALNFGFMLWNNKKKSSNLERAAQPTVPASILEKMSAMVARSKSDHLTILPDCRFASLVCSEGPADPFYVAAVLLLPELSDGWSWPLSVLWIWKPDKERPHSLFELFSKRTFFWKTNYCMQKKVSVMNEYLKIWAFSIKTTQTVLFGLCFCQQNTLIVIFFKHLCWQ